MWYVQVGKSGVAYVSGSNRRYLWKCIGIDLVKPLKGSIFFYCIANILKTMFHQGKIQIQGFQKASQFGKIWSRNLAHLKSVSQLLLTQHFPERRVTDAAGCASP